MDKPLPDKIDNFFLDNLKLYEEEPGKNTWSVIDKRLTESERNKTAISKIAVLSIAAVIMLCLLTPLVLIDPYFNQKHPAEKNVAGKKSGEYSSVQATVKNGISINTNRTKIITSGVKENNQNSTVADEIFIKDFSIAGIPFLHGSGLINTQKIQRQLINMPGIIFSNNTSGSKNKTNTSKAVSTVIKLSEKYNFSLSPFFSFDHISGRFIEQYEFDHEGKNDYQNRERPDMSFTAGVLTEYALDKKISLVSGVSFSNSNVSISSTAINALKDENGTYKFKLATSYGFAEIAQSGITPSAGDSLVVSSASLKFNYLSFPVMMKYNLRSKKIKLSVHGGIALNKIMSDKVEAEYHVQNNNEIETVNRIEGIKKIFFTMNAGVEAGYAVNRKIDIALSPEIRYGINSINKATPVKTYPINYGLGVHVNFKL